MLLILTVVEAAASHLFGPRDQHYEACQNQLELEQNNLRAALRWLIAQRQTDEAQRLGGALRYFWFFQGHVSEGRAWLAQLASLPCSASPTAGRASVLSGAAILAFQHGDYETTRIMAHDAETLWRQLGKDVERGLALFNLGSVAGIFGKRLEARALHEEALGLSRVAGERTVAARTVKALNLYGLSEWRLAKATIHAHVPGPRPPWPPRVNWAWPPLATAPSLECLATLASRKATSRRPASPLKTAWPRRATSVGIGGVGQALVRVAHVAIEQGDLERAAEVLAEAFDAYRDQGNRTGLIVCLEALAYLEAKRGRVSAALRLAGAAATLRETTNTPAGTTERRRLARWPGSAREALGEHASELVLAQARVAPTEQVIAEALAVLNAPADSPAPPEGRTSTPGAAAPLTHREQQVVVLLAQGLTNLQIAEALGLSERTVESHVRNALSKLDLTSRVSLARWAFEQQLRGPRPAP
jgi:DNA-binding CsgD family transcriptional regulator